MSRKYPFGCLLPEFVDESQQRMAEFLKPTCDWCESAPDRFIMYRPEDAPLNCEYVCPDCAEVHDKLFRKEW